MRGYMRNNVYRVFLVAASSQAQLFNQSRTLFALCAKRNLPNCLRTIDTFATTSFQLKVEKI
eukprot:9742058-Heterocapsa_arctica.AAC.1